MEEEDEGGAPRQQFVLGTPIPEPSCGWLQQHHMGKFRGEFLLTMAEKEAIEAAWQPMATLLSLSSLRLKLLAMPDYESDMEVPDEALPTMPGMLTAEDQSAAPGRAASAATPATSGRGKGRGRAAAAATASEAASAPGRGGKGAAGKGQSERRSGRDRKTVDLYQAGQAPAQPASSSKVSARQAAPKRATAAATRKVQEPSPSKRERQKQMSRKSSTAAAATKDGDSSSSSSDDSDDSEKSGSNKGDEDEDLNISEELQDLFASMSESESESHKKKKKKKKAKEQPQRQQRQVKKAGKEPAKKAGKEKQKGGRGAKRKSRSSSSSDADESPPPRQQAKKKEKAKSKEKERGKEKGKTKAEEAKRGPRGGRGGAAAKAPAAPAQAAPAAAAASSTSAGKSMQKQQQKQKQPPPGLTEDEKKQLQDKIELLNDEQLDKVLAYLGCGTDEEGGMIVEIPLNTLPVEKQLGLRKLVEAELRADQGDEQGDALRGGIAADAAVTAQANPLGTAAVPDSPAFPTFEPGPTPRTPLAGATPQSQSHEDRGAGADNFAAAPRKHIWEDYSAREVQRVSQAREVSHSGSTPAVTPLGGDPVVGDAVMPDLTLPAAALSGQGGGEAASTSAVQEEAGEGAPIMPPPQFPVATENDSMMEQAAEVLGMMDG